MIARQVSHPHQSVVEAAALRSLVTGDCQQLVLTDTVQRRSGEADLTEACVLTVDEDELLTILVRWV